MGRRKIYDYDSIQIDFESGVTEQDILVKYDIPRTTLRSYSKHHEWDKSQRQQRVTTANIAKIPERDTVNLSNQLPEELEEWKRRVSKSKEVYADITKWTHESLSILNEKIILLKNSKKQTDVDLLIRCITAFANASQKLTVNLAGEKRVFSEEVSMMMHQLAEKERQELAIKETELTILKDFAEKRTA